MRIIQWFGLIGLSIGLLLFIITRAGLEIPIVIGTTTYEGMASSLILLIGAPIVMLVVGVVATVCTVRR